MKRIFPIVTLIVLVLMPASARSFDREVYIGRLFQLLHEGESREKQLALYKLDILRVSDYENDQDVFRPILNALHDEDPLVRETAASTLMLIGEDSPGCCGDSGIVPALIRTLSDDDPRVRAEAAAALGYFSDNRAVIPLIERLEEKDPWVRLNVVHALGELRAYQAVGILLELLYERPAWEHEFVRQEALTALEKIRPAGTSRAVLTLVRAYTDSYLSAYAVRALDNLGREKNRALYGIMHDDEGTLGKAAGSLMKRYIRTDPERDSKIKHFLPLLSDPSPSVRLSAVKELGGLRAEEAIDPLIGMMKSEDKKTGEAVIKSLALFNDGRVPKALIEQFNNYKNSKRAGRIPFNDLSPYRAVAYYKNPAVKAFMQYCMKTAGEKLVVYRQGGIKYTVDSRTILPEGVNAVERMSNPAAVSLLIEALKSAGRGTRLEIFTIINHFEDERIEDVLIEFLNDPDAGVRKEAARILSVYGTVKSEPELINALNDTSDLVRTEAAGALLRFGSPGALKALTEEHRDTNSRVQLISIEALGARDDEAALTVLKAKLSDEDYRIRKAALIALRKYDDPGLFDVYEDMLDDESPHVRRAAVESMAEDPDEKTVNVLLSLLKRPDMKMSAISALGRTGGNREVAALTETLECTDNISERISLIIALGNTGNANAVPALIKNLDDQNPRIRKTSLESLRGVGTPEALNKLISLLDDSDRNIRFLALENIAKLDGATATDILTSQLTGDADYPTLSRTISLLGDIRTDDSFRALMEYCGGDTTLYGSLSGTINRFSDPHFADTAIQLVDEGGAYLNRCMVSYLGEHGGEKAIGSLKKFIRPQGGTLSAEADSRLRKILNPAQYIKKYVPGRFEQMVDALSGEDVFAKPEIVARLGVSGKKEAVNYILPLLDDVDVYTKREAATALGELKADEIEDHLIIALGDPDDFVRANAAWSLGMIGGAKTVGPLVRGLQDQKKIVRRSAAYALALVKKDAESLTTLITLFITEFRNNNLDRTGAILNILTKEELINSIENEQGEIYRSIKEYAQNRGPASAKKNEE